MKSTVNGKHIYLVGEQQELTWWDRLTLHFCHPRSLIFHSAAALWTGYFLWLHDWQAALGATLMFSLLALASVWHLDTSGLAQSRWGKKALTHLRPANLIMDLLGLALMCWGLWGHMFTYILIGITVSLVGHIFDWDE